MCSKDSGMALHHLLKESCLRSKWCLINDAWSFSIVDKSRGFRLGVVMTDGPSKSLNAAAAAGRVLEYIERRRRGRGIDHEDIHAFDASQDGGVYLRASDLEIMATALTSQPTDAAPALDMERFGDTSLHPNAGWRSHDGTSDPDVPGDTLVEVCFRDGDTAFGLVYDWDQNWQWAKTSGGTKSAGAIIAWRPHGLTRSEASEKCRHCRGTGDASEKGRIEECLACNGTGKAKRKPARWEAQRPSDGEWVLVSQDEAKRFEDLGRTVRALFPETASKFST